MDSAANSVEEEPSWLDRSRYPFEANWTELPLGTVHYVDDGPTDRSSPDDSTDSDGYGSSSGPVPVVFLHGNPTWSFLYRHLIRALRSEYRCIAPDFPGFGLSEKPASFSYRPSALAAAFSAFVERLDLDEMVLVVHDWGGPIGMDYATRNPDNVTGIVAMNTWCWPRQRVFEQLSSAVTHTGLVRWLCRRYNVFARGAIAPLVLSALFSGAFDRTRALWRHYMRPLDAIEARRATWTLSGEVGRSLDWLSRLWDRRNSLDETPIRLLWGRRDPIHGSFVHRWKSGFPDTQTTILEDVGHFVPEECGAALVEPVRTFLEGR